MRSIKLAILITILANVFVFGGSLSQDASTASANPAPNSCQPYGPKPGYQYDPEKLMDRMGVPRDNHPGPFLSAHRGVWGVWDSSESRVPNKIAPENSIAAIDNAAALKFEMVELDIKLTKDKKLVLMHDYTMGRVTDWGVKKSRTYGNWNPFNGALSNGNKPQSEPPNWGLLHQYNPLVSHIYLSDMQGVKLRAFKKNTTVSMGIYEKNINNNTITVGARGEWIQTDQKVPTLEEALQHIGDNYPGMTVVLDLRHADEVKEAVKVINQVTNCQGVAAKEWVILKPFANVFPGGFYNAHGTYPQSRDNPADVDSVYCSFKRWFGSGGSGYQVNNCNATGPWSDPNIKFNDYKWIPVISTRLVPSASKGEESVIPYAPGPDTSQITADVVKYLEDWNLSQLNRTSVVTAEVGYINPTHNTDITRAYNFVKDRVTNMQSWRPPDIDVVAPVADPGNQGKKIIGFNWKDDGLGVYPIYEGGSRTYKEARVNAGIITVDEALTVLEEEAATREMVQMSISKPVKDRIVHNVYYKLKNVAYNRLLSVTPSNGDSTQGIPDNDTQYSEWQAYLMPNGYYILWNPKVDRLLTENMPYIYPTFVQPDDGNYIRQYWKIESNGDGTFRVTNKHSNRVLKMDSNYVTSSQNGNPAANNEKWIFEPVPAAMYIWNTINDKTLAYYGAYPSQDTPVIMYTKFNSWYNEHWKLIRIEEPHKYNLYKIVERNSGKVLGAATYGSDLEGTTVTIQDYTNQAHQKWRLVNNNHGSFKIVNEKTNMVLTVRKVDTRHSDIVENEDYVEIRSFSETSRAQRWGMSILPQPY